MNREIRLFRYLSKNPGYNSRDKIMHWTGFLSPKDHPVAAYVEFQNAVMRLNSRIGRLGFHIVRGAPRFVGDKSENYQLASLARRAA